MGRGTEEPFALRAVGDCDAWEGGRGGHGGEVGGSDGWLRAWGRKVGGIDDAIVQALG